MNLFEQTKNLKGPLGERLSGEPEVLHEAELWVSGAISRVSRALSRNQIQIILENVPSVFPENWKSPESYDKMSEPEQKTYQGICREGPPYAVPGPLIQRVIEFGVYYRDNYSSE